MRIKSFYEHLEDWLSDLIEEKILLTFYNEITIYQQSLDAYYVKKFILIAGDQKIEFIPKVNSAVGTTGTIEMKTKKVKIIFVSDRDGIWKQVISRSPFEVRTLTKDYFRNLLRSLLT